MTTVPCVPLAAALLSLAASLLPVLGSPLPHPSGASGALGTPGASGGIGAPGTAAEAGLARAAATGLGPESAARSATRSAAPAAAVGARRSPGQDAEGERGDGPADREAAEPPTDPAARALWERVREATLLHGASATAPVTAFALELEVLTREGTGSNELRPRLSWLAPDLLRFEISRGLEEGRGPEGYWLREDDEVVRLAGREYVEDRRQIENLLLVVRNFVALTQPGSLEVGGLRTLAEPPPEIPRGHALSSAAMRRRLAWLELETSDLLLEPLDPFAASAPTVRVRLGVDRDTKLPVVALVSDPATPAAPRLLHLDDHRPLDDLRIPHRVFVYGFERTPPGWRVLEKPHQEMYVLGGTVRASLAPEDFAPSR